ncbi:CYTH domain-containing protein [Niveibacterium sp. SC-1]|uniref:CYTH domain-containing protein n=1 Tax=Niveibacterium sp. SC-1 TaxID=3135646 RepID=UPI00311FFD21
MSTEIERRYLVADPTIIEPRDGALIAQGYLSKESGRMTTRVRISGARAWLTLKSPRQGSMREEYEYLIPLKDAREILERHCVGRVLCKTRYAVPFGRHVFEVDVFGGVLAGLVIAEVELSSPEEAVETPGWIGQDITGDTRYGNRSLAMFGLPEEFSAGLASRRSRQGDGRASPFASMHRCAFCAS